MERNKSLASIEIEIMLASVRHLGHHTESGRDLSNGSLTTESLQRMSLTGLMPLSV